MKKQKTVKNKNQFGFAHPLLLVVLLIGVIGVVGYSGQRVLSQRAQEQSNASRQTQKQIVISNKPSEDSDVDKVSVASKGSAAAAQSRNKSNSSNSSDTATAAPKIDISDNYNVQSPIGSLSQLLFELKKGNYSHALYFVTPRLLSNANKVISLNDIENFDANCQANSVCKTLLSSTYQIDPAHAYESLCNLPEDSLYVECKTLSMKFKLQDGTISSEYYKSVGPNRYTASVMLLRTEGSSNWMVDAITVENFSL